MKNKKTKLDEKEMLKLIKKFIPNFETLRDVEIENGGRIITLKSVYKENNKQRYISLAKKLEECTEYDPCKSMACAKCQRTRRLQILSKWLSFFLENKGYKMATLIIYKDMTPNKKLSQMDIDALSQRLNKTIRRIGFEKPVIGGFDMDYHNYTHDSKGSHWMPHFHLLVPNEPEKLERLRSYMLRPQNLYARKGRKNRPIRIDDIDNVASALSYCVTGMWLEIAWFINEDGKLKKFKNKRRILDKRVFAKSLIKLNRLKASQLNFGVNVQKR
ncbi:hypothetical protein KU905_001141 [Salmonella enterica subsp. enterica]|nr:hypothetical protein [Salmonella enterica subsp. enterica serovar Infantis]EHR9462084.1 hypothetical protein [Salmonella enterica subsp. enterica]